MTEDQLTRVFLDFRDALKSIVRRMIRDPMDVEDIVHEAYVRSLIASRKRAIDSPKAYLARSARNLAINHINRAGSLLTDPMGDAEYPDEGLGETGMEDGLQSDRRLQLTCEAIEGLPVQCRRVFTLKQVYGLSQKEIARKLDISEKTVEYHVSKGLLHCRRYIREALGAPTTNESAVNRRLRP